MAAQNRASLACSCSCDEVIPELSNQASPRLLASNSTGRVTKENRVVKAKNITPINSRYGNTVMVNIPARSIHCIYLLMLHGVATFVCGNGGGGNATAHIYFGREVDGFFDRVVVVGKLAFYRDYLNIGDAVIAQHFLCYFGAGEVSAEGYFGILFEFAF